MSELPPAGWYPDPDDPAQQRYWDGAAWTDHRAPAAPSTNDAAGQEQQQTWGGTPQQGWGGQAGATWGTGTPGPKTSGLAIAALVLSLIWLGGFGSVLAVILGFVALSQIKKSEGQQTGRGMAIAGVVIGILGTIATALLIALFVFAVESVPNDMEEFFDCIEREIETGQDLNC